MDDNLPQNIEQAIERLFAELPLKQKREIANTSQDELANFHLTLGLYIRNEFDLWKNHNLMNSCRNISGIGIDEDKASSLIVKELWKRLQVLKILRVVK